MREKMLRKGGATMWFEVSMDQPDSVNTQRLKLVLNLNSRIIQFKHC